MASRLGLQTEMAGKMTGMIRFFTGKEGGERDNHLEVQGEKKRNRQLDIETVNWSTHLPCLTSAVIMVIGSPQKGPIKGNYICFSAFYHIERWRCLSPPLSV